MKLPEEFWVDFDQLTDLLNQRLQAVLDDIMSTHLATTDLSNKDLGMLMRNDHGLPEIGKQFVFQVRKYGGFFGGFLDAVIDGPCDRLSIRGRLFEIIRPSGNVLEGYTPSTVMNRFNVETS